MKPVAQVVLTGALVGGAGLAAWTFLPKLQSPRNLVATEAGENSEIARRLIDQYDPGADVAQTVVDRAGIDDDLTGERVNSLIESDSRRAQDVLEQEAERINEMLKDSVNRLREHDQKFSEMAGDTVSTTSGSVNFGNNSSSMSQSMNDGLSQSKSVAQSNADFLKSATSASAKALQASAGEASGRDSLIGNRTHGVALYHEGLSLDRKARLVRSEADAKLFDLSQLAAKQRHRQSESELVKDSGIEEAIQKQNGRVAEAQQEHDEFVKSAQGIESRIEAVKSEIETHSATASTLRKTLDDLESRGVEFGDQGAGDAFQQEYETTSASYRSVLSRIHTLQHGSISGAHLEMGGDLVTGDYVPDKDGGEIEYELGLDELERRLVQLGWEETGAKQVLDDEKDELNRLENLKSSLVAKASAARTAMDEGNQEVSSLFEAYRGLETEAKTLEDQAIDTLKQASRAFASAKSAAQARMRDLPEVSAEKEEFSPNKLIKEDIWLEGQLASQAADSQTRAAMVLYDRFMHLGKAIALCESLGSVFGELDFGVAEMSEARAAAKADAESILNDAIESFEGASRKLKEHWSVAASVAAADYMLALFDHPELVNVAIANYQSVVKDRESEPRLRPFVERLDQLRHR
ncbi:MAG: hypothetical protein KDA54_02900 [Phycisphaerales bacterium]|nr:hypothetical protein [Phycisphaerales bacterium]